MTESMNIIFLGGMFPRGSEQWILDNSKGNVQNPANVLQWNLVDGLATQVGDNFKVISSLFIGSYPAHFKKIRIPNSQFFVSNKARGSCVGFYNLPVFKHLSKYLSLRKPLQTATNSTSLSNVLIGYSFTYPIAYSLRRAKRADPSVITCLVVPDLPELLYQSQESSFLKRRVQARLLERLLGTLEYIDCLVVLTEPMISRLGYKKPYVVIEGVADAVPLEKGIDSRNQNENSKGPRIMYSGAMKEKYGILHLVEAFLQISDPSARLILCGVGDADSKIREFAGRDSRIIQMGLIPRDEVIALQQAATVLVNPRQNVGDYVKYSFPSKLIEYLTSGTPVVAYHLDGMPAEYKNYIVSVPDNSVSSLRDAIQDVCNLTPAQRRDLGQRGREFVLESKNPAIQTNKILRMLSEIT